MTSNNDNGPTLFTIEALRMVYLARHEDGLLRDEQTLAWVRVGEIDMEGEYPNSEGALYSWQAEQPQEPPLGLYRLLVVHGAITTVEELEIRETRERVIERVEQRPVSYANGTTDATSEAFDVISDLAAGTRGEER